MEALKFTLKGDFAFFKKPEVNKNVYFSYSHIHKVALMGLIGSILGLKGYIQQKDNEVYPEFYNELHDLKVAIVPRLEFAPNGIFNSKIQTFVNSVGYASQEEGNTLIVYEKWIEKPCWDIYVLEGHKHYEKICQMILDSQCVFIPYLGKNDHQASIISPTIVSLKEITDCNPTIINSLADFNEVKIKDESFILRDFESSKRTFLYKESLPFELTQELNAYVLKPYILTSKKVTTDSYFSDLINERNIVFI